MHCSWDNTYGGTQVEFPWIPQMGFHNIKRAAARGEDGFSKCVCSRWKNSVLFFRSWCWFSQWDVLLLALCFGKWQVCFSRGHLMYFHSLWFPHRSQTQSQWWIVPHQKAISADYTVIPYRAGGCLFPEVKHSAEDWSALKFLSDALTIKLCKHANSQRRIKQLRPASPGMFNLGPSREKTFC